jgi:hypothetical protein
MAFEVLLNIKMNEEEIFDRAVEILQKNFYAFQDVNVCLELGEAQGPVSKAQCAVKAIKYYSRTNEKDIAAKREFIFHGEFHKVYLITKYLDRGFYHVSLFGHFTSKHGDVYSSKIINVDVFRSSTDGAKDKMIPFEILDGAFGEIATLVNGVGHKKSS